MNIKNPLLIDFPIPLETKRLTIRPLMPGDGPNLFEAIDGSRVSLRPWLGWVDSVKTWEDSEINAREFYARFILRTESTFLILRTNRLVGAAVIMIFIGAFLLLLSVIGVAHQSKVRDTSGKRWGP
jgi:hypothetical protein